jgi:predicted TPR repeat methyltransferase
MTIDEALALAVVSHRAGRFSEAAVIYRQILAVAPDSVDALHFLGVAEHQAGRPEVALRYLDRALALAPEHADARCSRGSVHRGLGHLDAAEADYRRALVGRPDDPNTLGHLGTVLQARGDGEGAVAAFRASLARKPDQASTWRNLGATLAELQRGQEAVAAYREATRLAPGSAGTFRDLGIALHVDGRLPEAIAMFRQCLALDPKDARARHLLAASTGEGVPARAPDDYVRAEFDCFAATFDTKLASLEYRGPALVCEVARQIIGRLPARPAVLDAGCGTGLCGPLLRPLAGSLDGVDLSPAMVEQARRRKLYDELIVDELTAYLRAHRGCQDLIVSADTLVYFGDLADVIAAAAATLRAGGVLVFTLEQAEPTEAPTGWKLYPHGRFGHTRDHVARALGAAGLADPLIREITSRKEAGRWVPGWLVRAQRPLG